MEAFARHIGVFAVIADTLVKGLVDTDVNGIYYDILRFLMMAIFNLQVEEEEEEKELSQVATSKGMLTTLLESKVSLSSNMNSGTKN